MVECAMANHTWSGRCKEEVQTVAKLCQVDAVVEKLPASRTRRISLCSIADAKKQDGGHGTCEDTKVQNMRDREFICEGRSNDDLNGKVVQSSRGCREKE